MGRELQSRLWLLPRSRGLFSRRTEINGFRLQVLRTQGLQASINATASISSNLDKAFPFNTNHGKPLNSVLLLNKPKSRQLPPNQTMPPNPPSQHFCLFAALRRNHDMAEKKQWNIRVEDQLIDRLNTLAPKAGYASGNEFAAEALDMWAETLADLMIKLREIERNAVKLQREQLLAKLRQVQDSGTERRK